MHALSRRERKETLMLNELYEFAEKQGVTVDCFSLHDTESLSVLYDGECYVAIDPMLLRSEGDEAVKLAHELGHCVCGAFYNRYTPLEVAGKCEKIANRWAIKRLIPEEVLSRAYREGYKESWEIAEYLSLPEKFVKMAMEFYMSRIEGA